MSSEDPRTIRWSNWAGNEQVAPQRLHVARSVEDAQAVVASAAGEGLKVRVAGSGHSHYRLVPTDDVLLDMSALGGVVGVEQGHAHGGVATLRASTTIAALGRPLRELGLAFHNQGDIDRQSIAGAIATGTHGTGLNLQSLSAMVVGLRLINASGELIRINASSNPELLDVARLNLGALGVVTEVEMSLVNAYRLSDSVSIESYGDLRPTIAERAEQHRHFEFFWYPQHDKAMIKTIDDTDGDPVYPTGEEGSRVGWSHEVLPSHRPHLHTEMEYSVPLDESLACLDALRDLLHRDFPTLLWPVEYRTLASDDVWLSTAYQRPTATISVHQGIDLPADQLFAACENVFRDFDGRPHWGKVHGLGKDELAAVHPRWSDWWQLRNQFDPHGTFLNERLSGWAGL